MGSKLGGGRGGTSGEARSGVCVHTSSAGACPRPASCCSRASGERDAAAQLLSTLFPFQPSLHAMSSPFSPSPLATPFPSHRRSHAANVRRHPAAPLLYAFSVQLCLPSGMSAPGGEALGTMGVSAVSMWAIQRKGGTRWAVTWVDGPACRPSGRRTGSRWAIACTQRRGQSSLLGGPATRGPARAWLV